MHCTSNLLGRKKEKKNDPTIERGKIGHGTTNSKPL
jgi:hypothetical protein